MAEKSKYIVIVNSNKAFFYKVDNGTLDPIKVTYNDIKTHFIDTNISLKSNYIDYEIAKDEQIDYPNHIQQYGDACVPFYYKSENDSLFITKNLTMIIKKCIELIKNEFPEKKEIYCFTTNICFSPMGFFDYGYLNYHISDPEFKKMISFTDEIYELIACFTKKKPSIYIASDSAIETSSDERHIHSRMLLEYFNTVEEIIRNKYYFLSKYDDYMIFSLSLAFFYETLKPNRKNECISQDISIVFTDEDYKRIEDLITKAYYQSLVDFKNKYPEGIYIDFTTNPISKKLFNLAVEQLKDDTIKIIDAKEFLHILCEFHKINYLITNMVETKRKFPNTYDFIILAEEYIRRFKHLSSSQKVEIKSKMAYFKNKHKSSVKEIIEKDKQLQH